VYPALLPLMRTPRLPAVDWTDAPADLNGLVRFAERRNLLSARVPSHLNWPLLSICFVIVTMYGGWCSPVVRLAGLYFTPSIGLSSADWFLPRRKINKCGASDLPGLQFLLRLSSLSKLTQFHGTPVCVISLRPLRKYGASLVLYSNVYKSLFKSEQL